EPAKVDAGAAHGVDVADGNAVDALHHHDVAPRVVPVHARHVQQVRVAEVVAQLAGVGTLAYQVELVVDGLVELADHLRRSQPPALGPVLLGQPGEDVKQVEIAVDGALDAGPEHL